MSKLYKVAKIFQQKLTFASATNLENLKSIFQASEYLGKTKRLWEASSTNPYEDLSSDLGNAINKITSMGRRGYSQATTQGMPAQGQYGYSGFLNNMQQAIQELEKIEFDPNSLDPMASKALGNLKQAVEKGRSEFVPVGIPAPAPQKITMPQETIHGKQHEPGGAAYQAEMPGADPAALSQVVHNLVDKNHPLAPGTKRDWDDLFNQ